MSANDDAVRSRRVEKEILMSPKRCLSGALSGQYWEKGFTAEEICSDRQKSGIVFLPKDHKSKM